MTFRFQRPLESILVGGSGRVGRAVAKPTFFWMDERTATFFGWTRGRPLFSGWTRGRPLFSDGREDGHFFLDGREDGHFFRMDERTATFGKSYNLVGFATALPTLPLNAIKLRDKYATKTRFLASTWFLILDFLSKNKF